MDGTMERRLRHVVRSVRDQLPSPWNVTTFVSNVSVGRTRPVRLIPWNFENPNVSGLWIPTDQADYIVFSAEAPPSRRDMIICHELAHILLGHSPSFDTTDPALVQALFPSLDVSVALRALQRTGYDAREEAMTEQCATMLVEAGLTKKQPPSLGDELGRLTDSLR